MFVLPGVAASAPQPRAGLPDAQQMAPYSRWLGIVAHELRRPLSPITIAASLLHQSAGDEQKLARLQSVIERQVEQLSRVIADLTDATRACTGRLSIERRTIVSTAFVEQAVEACRASIASREQRLVLRLPRRPFRLHADPGRLTQILVNLIDNASKFSARRTTIVVSLAVRREQAQIAVADEGIGIAPAALPTLFDPAFQQGRAVRPTGAGLGLGLSIVRELAEGHGGCVRAMSAGEGRGARLVVWLPNDAQAASDGTATHAPSTARPARRNTHTPGSLEAA
ncbi:MAG TPA: HAMP domain-containing sensor histidine kinase [Zeimonas sp.]